MGTQYFTTTIRGLNNFNKFYMDTFLHFLGGFSRLLMHLPQASRLRWRWSFTRFCLDNWASDNILAKSFPNLFLVAALDPSEMMDKQYCALNGGMILAPHSRR